MWPFRKNKRSSPHTISAGIVASRDVDVAYFTAGSKQVNSTVYLQDRISKLKGQTVRLRFVRPHEAKLPDGWDEIRGDYAVVDPKGTLYGTAYEETLQKQGYQYGDFFDAVIGRPPKSGSRYTLEIPKSKRAICHEFMHFSFSIGKDGNVSPQAIGRYGAVFEKLPPKKGSSAKPRIGCLRQGNMVFDIGAKTSAYNRLCSLIGQPCYLTVTKRKSKFDDGFYHEVKVDVM